MAKNKYYAYVQNDNGATDDVPLQTYSKKELKTYIRANYGRGWTVHIMAVDLITFAIEKIEQFRLRK